jgi:choline dehydrogenase-like flavoprotein
LNASTGQRPLRASAWLSRGLETLIRSLPSRRTPEGFHFDIVIVGSGYGGAVAAAEFAGARNRHDGRPLSVCVLERGREYLPGAFPSRLADMARQVRFTSPKRPTPKGERSGLFDLRLGPDVHAVLGNGLGGGSLINAGVMALPLDSVFTEAQWPSALRGGVRAYAERLLPLLGARAYAAADALPKHALLRALAANDRFESPAVSIASRAGERSSAGVDLGQCNGCGDCFTGCNRGAKQSLDVGLLASAEAAGAQIYTGATVLHLEASDTGGWKLLLNHTDDKLRRRQRTPPDITLTARRIVLAAGTFGSTEILMRSSRRQPGLRLSSMLGQRFSANGDVLAVLHDTERETRALPEETCDPDVAPGRRAGSTITGMIDLRTGDRDSDLVIQDLSIAAPLRRLFEQVVTTADALRLLAQSDRRRHARHDVEPDECAVDPAKIERSLTLALIGRDNAAGELAWPEHPLGRLDDGVLHVRWPALRDDPRLLQQHRRLAALLQRSRVGGQVLANPLWRALPDPLAAVMGDRRGPLITVHPLGGCAMGDDVSSGVVDHLGRVFDADAPAPGAVHDGLVVLDGSIVPGSLGINPALTIGALALRAAEGLREDWGFDKGTAAGAAARAARPMLRTVPTHTQPRPTLIEVTERLRGDAQWDGDTSGRPHTIELTLCSKPTPVAALMDATGPRLLHFDPTQSRVRIIAPDERVVAEASLSGTLELFARERSRAWQRRAAALPQWLVARGLRDAAGWLRERRTLRTSDRGTRGEVLRRAFRHAVNAFRIASRAGGVRLLDYRLQIEQPIGALPDGAVVHGIKRLCYRRAASPWTQLSDVTLLQFPGLSQGATPSLRLDMPFFAQRGVPLLRIVDQQDKPTALADLASLGLYVTRVLLHIHLWSLRKPDRADTGAPQRLPGPLPGMPMPSVHAVSVPTLLVRDDGSEEAMSVRVRLTRYGPPASARTREPPVLLIHGYSSSGTTFAHPALKPGLARVLYEAGRDVWVADLRTSAGMPTATLPWSMEQVAQEDIPHAVEHVLAATGFEQLDLVVHCMGSAMTCMALLADNPPLLRVGTDRRPLHDCVRRMAMSQVGPATRMSDANIGRAFYWRYVTRVLPLTGYTFRSDAPTLADEMLDRVLATLPYPPDELAFENPWQPARTTPWTSTRHRMDLFYNADFRVTNVDRDVLARLDDFFGPLNVQTLSQGLHFARSAAITDRYGVSRYLDPARVRERLRFPMLHVHGSRNAMWDVATLDAATQAFSDLGPGGSFKALRFEGFGHQDCLIGRHAIVVLRAIEEFLA